MTETLSAAGGMGVDEAEASWWFNRRSSGGFRLTDEGARFLKENLELTHYELKIESKDLDSRTLLALDKSLESPYYIVYRKRTPVAIMFFGSRDATMAYLYDDLKLFAKNTPTGTRST